MVNQYALVTDLMGVDDPELRDVARAQAGTLSKILDDRAEAARKIMADSGLSSSGRQTRLKGLSEITLREIDDIERVRFAGKWNAKTLEDEVQRRRGVLAERLNFREDSGGLTSVIPEKERPLAVQREREIRDRLLALEEAQRFPVAMSAAADDDRETLRSIRNAPRSFPVLSAKEWSQVDEFHICQHFKAEAAGIEALENLKGTLTFNANMARQALK